MQNIAMSWLVYRLTGSEFLLGLIGFTSQIPNFFISPLAGVLIDRVSRHKVMLITQALFMGQALLLSFLVLFNLIQIWHIVVLSLFFGIISAFDAPTRQSLVIDLIDNPKNLGNAIALNSAMFNGARLFGPAIAGIIIAIVGEGFCFLLNAFSFITIIWALYKMKIIQKERKNAINNAKQEFIEGLKYIIKHKPIRTLLILLSVVSLFGTPVITLMPAYASEILKGDSHTYGFLMSAIGAGALLGAVYLASLRNVSRLAKLISINAIIFGICLAGISFCKTINISLFICFTAGLSMITVIASINTLVQTLADEDKRGRVMSFYAMALMGMSPIGNLLAGTIASGIGISLTFFFSGIITIIIGFWFMFILPSLHKV